MPDHVEKSQQTRGALQGSSSSTTAWHEAGPGKGYAAKAAEWREKLPEENGE